MVDPLDLCPECGEKLESPADYEVKIIASVQPDWELQPWCSECGWVAPAEGQPIAYPRIN